MAKKKRKTQIEPWMEEFADDLNDGVQDGIDDTLRLLLKYMPPARAGAGPSAGTPNPWKEAVIEACIVNHLSWDESDPVKSLRNLIQWEVTIALDPAVSKEAQDLIDRGRVTGADTPTGTLDFSKGERGKYAVCTCGHKGRSHGPNWNGESPEKEATGFPVCHYPGCPCLNYCRPLRVVRVDSVLPATPTKANAAVPSHVFTRHATYTGTGCAICGKAEEFHPATPKEKA